MSLETVGGLNKVSVYYIQTLTVFKRSGFQCTRVWSILEVFSRKLIRVSEILLLPIFLNTSAVSPLSSANLAFTCRTFCGFSENIHINCLKLFRRKQKVKLNVFSKIIPKLGLSRSNIKSSVLNIHVCHLKCLQDTGTWKSK